ncbi:putative disease resistance RPP13-like protein 1 [Morella rubra]|uniref:Putative disease resistance RPP13-like protein 1 n=1 Tax=Morella rubra TaxID=262757 RepID=A0A6A1UH65_9ROSI|nr:putative disease resistance RPP13-like protein 1 [Morella rubra]
MAEVGVALLSTVVKVVFDKLASPDVADLIRGKKLTQGLLRKLKIAVLSVNAVLEDAEEKQLTKPFVKDWIDELKDALYDADDIMDAIATEAMRSKLVAEFHTATGKVRSSISTFLERFVNEIEPKIKDVLSRVDDLAKQKDLMGLQEIAGRSKSKRLPTTPSIEESGTFGRNDDKKVIIDLLLSEDALSGDKKSVIAIVGMGGLGKTTLAQLVYRDRRVKEHFNLQVWFCISEEFVVSKVQKSIIETVTSSPCSGSSIRELGKLKNLQGTLSISKLQNVVPPKDALNAGLKDKKHLEKLALEWDATTPRSESERIVLESLRPHTSLKSLTIKGYGGGIFPDWVGHHSFSCITSIHLVECRNVCSLPPFGQLCSLKELSIVGLNGVVTVGREFCGNSSTGSSSIQPFGGLKVLRFEKMLGWEEWLSSSSAENEGGGFPDLKELCIQIALS